MPSVTTIVTTHSEGKLLFASVESCIASKKNLESAGVEVETLIVMDRPTHETRSAVAQSAAKSEAKVFEYDFGDQGLVRNQIILEAKGDYIAFLDGDDLWSDNWLVLAYKLANSIAEDVVIYPEFNWFFEGSSNILCQVDSNFEFFDSEALRGINLWDALCFCPKKVYEKVPFVKRQISEGFAFEDWNWNRRVMELGIRQLIAKDAIIFKRRRAGSQGEEASRRQVIAKPTLSSYYDYYTD